MIRKFQTNGLKFDHNDCSVGYGQLGLDLIAQLVGRSAGAFVHVLRPRRHMFLLVLQLQDPLMAVRSQPTNGDLCPLFASYVVACKPCVRSSSGHL